MGGDLHDRGDNGLRSVNAAQGCARRNVTRGCVKGLSSSERGRQKELERENRELGRINGILRKASAVFAQAEFDRRPQ